MHRPFAKKTFRHRLEERIDELADQTEDLRKQFVEKAPGVRDQLLAALPDKEQLLDLRDDVYERLPDSVSDRLPEKAKPKHARLKKIAVVGVVAGAGAAAFSVLRRRGTTPPPPEPFPEPASTTPPPPPDKPA